MVVAGGRAVDGWMKMKKRKVGDGWAQTLLYAGEEAMVKTMLDLQETGQRQEDTYT